MSKMQRKNGMEKKFWRFKLNTATIILIPAAIGINYLGKLFADLLQLPLWLDSIGTCLAAFVAGPIVGAIVGAAINIIYGLTRNPLSTVYALTNVVIAVVVALFAHKGYFQNIRKAVFLGIIVGILSTMVSAPLNLLIEGGAPEGFVGKAVLSLCQTQGFPEWIALLCEVLIVDIPDKILTIVSVYAVGRGLPESLLDLYQAADEAELSSLE